jgi:hypothetical protein
MKTAGAEGARRGSGQRPLDRSRGLRPVLRHRPKARRARPLEPILFPKLRIYFADFPYLHCRIN